MRLAFTLFSWFPHGGLQQDLLKVARACQPQAQISVFCMHWEGPRPADLDIREVPVRGWGGTAKRADFVRKVQRLTGDFDLVLGFNRMPGLDYYFAADSCYAHKAFGQRNWLYRLTPRARQYLQWEQAVFGAGSKTTALLLSPLQYQQYSHYYQTPEQRLHMLPPGISRRFIPGDDAGQTRAQLRSSLGLDDEAVLVLQVGSGFRSKGLDRSLQALAALPDAQRQKLHFLQIGHGDATPYRKQAQSLGLQRVRFLGGCDDVLPYMLAADLLLHPSRTESAGMVILEAIVSGLPVLTTAACGYAFHVEQAGAGLVCPEPFRQPQLNSLLQQMLEQDRQAWRQAALLYGQTQALYDMPARVAELLTGGRG